MPIKFKYKKTEFKCPKCGWECRYNIDKDLFVCFRPVVLSDGSSGGSCGLFYANGVKAR